MYHLDKLYLDENMLILLRMNLQHCYISMVQCLWGCNNLKVWRFYKKPTTVNEIPETISEEEKFPLYAITNNKKLAKK